jgi:hypothetical protein
VFVVEASQASVIVPAKAVTACMKAMQLKSNPNHRNLFFAETVLDTKFSPFDTVN